MKAFNKFLADTKSFLISFYLIILSLVWISVFIYVRFLIKRYPYNLTQLQETISLKYFLLNISFISVHIFFLCIAIYTIRKTRLKLQNNPSKIIIIINNLIEQIITKPFAKLCDILGPRIPYSGVIYCHFGTFLEKNTLFIAKFIAFMLNSLPRVIISLTFFIEIIFYHRIFYFIPILFLLLVPTFWMIFLTLFIDFGKKCLVDIPKYVKIIPIGEPLANGWHSKYRFEANPKYKYGENDLQEYQKLYFLAMNIYGYGEIHMKQFQQTITPYVTLITSSMYIFAGAYKLFVFLF